MLNAACVRLPDLSGVQAVTWDGGVVFSDEFDGDNLLMLEEKCKAALAMMRHGPQALLAAGKTHGGDAPIGGLTWLDWNDEFSDDLPLPQIVGHTADEVGARQKGRSWCVDGNQSCYAVLENGGCDVRDVTPCPSTAAQDTGR